MAIHTVTAWASEHQIVLGQLKIDDKSNEITAIPLLLDTLIEGSVISIDAMGCQKNIAEKVIEKKADYVFGLKGNQGRLQDEVEDFFKTAEEYDFFNVMYTEENEIDSEHGRIEERHCFAISSTYIDSAQDWRGANSVVMMNSKRWVEGALHTETRYYLSSLPPEAKSIGADSSTQILNLG